MASGLLIGLSLLFGVAVGHVALLVVLPTLIILNLLRQHARKAGIVVAMLCVVAGAIRGQADSGVMSVSMLAESTAATGVVQGLPVAGGDYERAVIQVDQLRLPDGTWVEADGQVIVYLPEGRAGVGSGDRLSVVWSATPVHGLAPGYGRFVASQGASGSATVWSYRIESQGNGWLRGFSSVRRRITSDLQRAIPGDAGALAAGIVTGDDSGLSPLVEQAFRRSGMSHITAVSGQNVALLIGFIAMWFRPGRRSTRTVIHVTMLVIVWLYVLMVGMEPPALRAAIVATCMMLGSWVGRRPDPLTILALALGGMAMVEPRMVGSVGFWLSAAASWALCSSMKTQGGRGIRFAALNTAKGVMAANIATLPILLWTFGEWSPIGLLANLLIGPVMMFAFPSAYVLAMLGFLLPPLIPWLAWIPAIGLDIAIVIVTRVSTVMPLVHLPMTGPGMAMLVALPCLGVLALMSRDGARWRALLAIDWAGRGMVARLVLPGMLAGGGLAWLIGSMWG